MKRITINIDDSIYEKFISLIKTFPKEKINFIDGIDDNQIPYMSI